MNTSEFQKSMANERFEKKSAIAMVGVSVVLLVACVFAFMNALA